MLKYLTKFAVDILPSVAATVIGAYIVNHYIVTKPGAAAPRARYRPLRPKAAKPAARPADKSTQSLEPPRSRRQGEGNLRAHADGAVGLRKGRGDREARRTESRRVQARRTPAETASIPAEPRRHQPAPREKAVAKVTPGPGCRAPVAPAAPPAAGSG